MSAPPGDRAVASGEEEGMSLYVYGIARADAPPQSTPIGLLDQPTYWLPAGPLAAIVSACPGKAMRAERKNIIASQRVLNRLNAEVDLLPMAFGTVADSEAALCEFLSAFQEGLLAQLQKVSGAIEMSLRLSLDVADPIAYLVARTPELQAARMRAFERQRPASYDEKLRLGQLCDMHLRRFRDSLAAQILAAVGPRCVETAVLAARTENEIANLAMLVARDGQDSFEAAVREAAATFDDDLVFSIAGPSPPHNFVRFEPIGR